MAAGSPWIRMIVALPVPARAGRQGRASARLWPRSAFRLPNRVIDAISGDPASEYIIGIYLSLEYLARWGLHVQLALWSYVSLKLKIERRKLRNAIVNGQSRCHRIIWALRSWGAHILGETAIVRSIAPPGGATASPGGAAVGRGRGSCGAQAATPRTDKLSNKGRFIYSFLLSEDPS